MLRNITLGQYYQYDSVIHRLDPRLKIFGTFLYLVMLFFVKDLVGYGIAALGLLAVIGVSHVPLRFILRGMRPIMFILAFTFLLNILLLPGTVLWQAGPITITEEGLRQAVFITIRLLLLVFGASVLTYTTKPMSLTDGFERVLSPLSKLGVQTHEIAMMMSIALRFIPTLVGETDKIMKAQLARGADFESGNILRRAKSMIPVLVPLFVNAFRIAQDLAMAMEARCYAGGRGRTRLHPMRCGIRDLVALVLLILFAALIFVQSRGMLPLPMIWKI